MTISSLDTEQPTKIIPAEGNVAAPFCAAVQFLTVLPPLLRRSFTQAELGWSLAFFPLVGGLLGGLLIGLDHLTGLIWPASVSVALVLAGWVLLTGGLHLDGFLDTCDGLLGGRTPEERLRILRDERVGSYAVIGGILLMLVKFTALGALANRELGLLLAPVVGRWGMVLAVIAFPYARAEGLGRDMKNHAGWWQGVIASLAALPWCAWAGGWWGLMGCGAALGTILAGAWFVLRRLPGMTGDIYGCCCELAEVVVLLTLVAGAV